MRRTAAGDVIARRPTPKHRGVLAPVDPDPPPAPEPAPPGGSLGGELVGEAVVYAVGAGLMWVLRQVFRAVVGLLS